MGKKKDNTNSKEVSQKKYDLKKINKKDLEKYPCLTPGDLLKDAVDDLYDNMIKSGQLFTIDIYQLTSIVNEKNRKELFETINKYSILDLVYEYKLDYTMVRDWLDRYISYNILTTRLNKQMVSRSSVTEQIVLVNYLRELEIINIEGIQDTNKKANLLSFLMNRDMETIRKDLSRSNLKTLNKDYYTQPILKKILTLAEEINFEALKDLIIRDQKKLEKIKLPS